tara:strand:- start:147 stop:569 length:423 start_codon:yes stop_codon:yes gene_type:complete
MEKPNYTDLGMASTMGPNLKEYVEKELVIGLKFYNCHVEDYKFDWTDSCIEGRCTRYLDGSLDRFSGIRVFNEKDELIAEGWMEFIFMRSINKLFIYWEFLDLITNGKAKEVKSQCGIPTYIFERLDEPTLEECRRLRLL